VNNTFRHSIAKGYEQLTNLQDTIAKDIKLKIQGEKNTSYIPNSDHQTNCITKVGKGFNE
jgi:hypothetical protein